MTLKRQKANQLKLLYKLLMQEKSMMCDLQLNSGIYDL